MVDEIAFLTDIANKYETEVLLLLPPPLKTFDFYKLWKWPEKENQYESIIPKLLSNYELKSIGSGSCCAVYRHKDYVIKLHTPYNEKINLLCNPTRHTLELCRKYAEPCDETGWYDLKAVEHFLFYEFITTEGFAAVQKFVDCSANARLQAREKFMNIDPYLVRCNHLANCGLDGENPVYIDWH